MLSTIIILFLFYFCMIYFLLPNIHNLIYKHIDCITTDFEIKNISVISTSLSFYLSDIQKKQKIYGKYWDEYSIYNNTYELIYHAIPNKTICVSKYTPISHIYFKMMEILLFFDIYSNTSYQKETTFSSFMNDSSTTNKSKYPPTIKSPTSKPIHIKQPSPFPIKIFHLTECPEAMFEVIANIRNNSMDTYIGIQKNHSMENTKPNIIFENFSNQGLCSMEHFIYCKNKYHSSIDLITSDITETIDTNTFTQQLFIQICYALCIQKKDGSFIFKIFNCFTEHTIDILYILSSFYEKVYITKPLICNSFDSEKYIVCKHFLFSTNHAFYPIIQNTLAKIITIEKPISIFRFLNINISSYYIGKLEEINSIFGQQQIENIYQTIVFIDTIKELQNVSLSETTQIPIYPIIHNQDINTEDDCLYHHTFDMIEDFTSLKISMSSADETSVSNLHLYNDNLFTPLSLIISSENRMNVQNCSKYPSSTSSSSIFQKNKKNKQKQIVSNQLCTSHPTNNSSMIDLNRVPRRGSNTNLQWYKLNNIIKTNIQKCIHWCIKYNIPYNELHHSILNMEEFH
jgi:23S rRNA U2552 (ribose-2'-O)-methylase RlmE/FtsJ